MGLAAPAQSTAPRRLSGFRRNGVRVFIDMLKCAACERSSVRPAVPFLRQSQLQHSNRDNEPCDVLFVTFKVAELFNCFISSS